MRPQISWPNIIKITIFCSYSILYNATTLYKYSTPNYMANKERLRIENARTSFSADAPCTKLSDVMAYDHR